MDSERLSFLALRFTPGIGDRLIKHLISYCGSAESVFKTSRTALSKIPGVGPMLVNAINQRNTFFEAERELQMADRDHVDILLYTEKPFPARLKAVEDSPALLYVKGNTNLNIPRTVGIVGTRSCTPYGREMTERFVEGLVPHQAMIISGLAYGIDIHAHKLALRHNLLTVAVLGSGMDIIYPSAHMEVARKIANAGALLTENRLGTKPDAHNFPARNRIIAGLCDALVVVEAAQKGGALITAEIANSYNKDVFAVPGNVGHPFSEGCNRLIRTNKAHLCTSVDDLAYIMNWLPENPGESLPLFNAAELPDDERRVMQVLRERNTPVIIDELSYRTELPVSALASALLNLEFKGLVASLPGKQFSLAVNGRS